jgi:biopolymer transport protein ExbB
LILQVLEILEQIQAFMETGGDVLSVIFAVTLAMWVLILERLWYFGLVHPEEARAVAARWAKRRDRSSWHAEQIRIMWLSELELKLKRSTALIKTLVALCPLLGLLGTVTGMIEVFDIMAMVGGGNSRAMASGVSLATIPTMAGMVAALSGLYFAARFDHVTRSKIAKADQTMALQRGAACVVA